MSVCVITRDDNRTTAACVYCVRQGRHVMSRFCVPSVKQIKQNKQTKKLYRNEYSRSVRRPFNILVQKNVGKISAVDLTRFFSIFCILSARKKYSKPLLFMCILRENYYFSS